MLNTKFGRLTVIGAAPKRVSTRHSFWKCRCDCGNEIVVDAQNLKNMHTKSCGCLRRDVGKRINLKHGKTHTTEFNIWVSMRQRCQNSKSRAYADYGGRGIYVDARWSKFEQFLADMGPRPGPKFTLDRIDNSGPYSPENCRWAEWDVQANNTRKNTLFEFQGRSLTLSQWARETGIRRNTLWARIYEYGWDVEKALTKECGHYAPVV